MIVYRPHDGEIPVRAPEPQPMTCFLMTQLGNPLPAELKNIRRRVTKHLKDKGISVVDADSVTTGKDFLDKIWKLLVSVPLGVAIIHENMPPKTMANVFYEMGMMDALGKQTIVIKSKGAAIPSDFVRTEYIVADAGFSKRFKSFLESFLNQEDYFELMADLHESNPIMALDYLRRASLISGDAKLANKARKILDHGKTGKLMQKGFTDFIDNF